MTGRSIGTPYNQFREAGNYDAIVVGSGIGGMGTAALLAKAAGRRVLVLERHYTAGGFTHVFHRPGFEWDVGIHYVGEVFRPESPAAAMFDYVAEGRLAWNRMPDAYDRVDIDGLRFDYISGRERLRDALVARFPAERDAIDRYFRAVRQTIARLAPYFTERVVPPVVARMIGGALRAPFLRRAKRTTREQLDALGASRELKAVLTAQWGDYGLPFGLSSFGIHAVIADHYAGGAAYPVGGASRIAASVLPTIERAGGALVVSAEVDRIIVDGTRAVGVRMADGREFRAASIVSDAGFRTTMDWLLRDERAVSEIAARTRTLPATWGHLCLYVGLDERERPLALNPANLWIHPGLDYDSNMSAFLHDVEAPFPFLYVSFPSMKDPTFQERYPGHHTIEMMTMAPYDRFSPWAGTRWKRRGADYDALKCRLANRMLAELRRHVPAVEGAIASYELSTPLSTRHFAGAPRGEAYGLAHTPARFESRDLQPRTPIRNLFLTGQDVAMVGVMGALSAAVLTASTMLGRNMFSVISRAGDSRASTRAAA